MQANTKLTFWDRIMMAITFAEAGEAETARKMLEKPQQKRPENRIDQQHERRPELRV